jgi:hypothetical protein
MKVFLSWSGDRSKAIAVVLRTWIPSVLQAVRPYFSPDDVAKGSRWSSEIARELEASSIGLLVVTPENQDAPWLNFEAGALAKSVQNSKVCPILFGGMEPTDVRGPLVQFQSAKFSKAEMIRVMKMINDELGEAGLASEIFESVFEMWWPRLDERVGEELAAQGDHAAEPRRPDRELLEEVLTLTRRLASEQASLEETAPSDSDEFLRVGFDDRILQEIKNRIPISRIVSRSVTLLPAGSILKGLSPFTKEKTPSFYVNDEKKIFKCFSSGLGGDIFKWLMLTEGLSFPEAVDRLAAEGGVTLPERP